MDRPFVLCGLGRMGARVLEHLHKAGLPVVVIDTVCKPDDPRLAGARLVRGDCRRREVLEEAGVADAARRPRPHRRRPAQHHHRPARARPQPRGPHRPAHVQPEPPRPARQGGPQRLRPQHLAADRAHPGPDRPVRPGAGQLPPRRVRLRAAPARRGHGRPRLAAARADARGHSMASAASWSSAHLPAEGEPRFLLDVDADRRPEAGDHLVVYGEPHQLSAAPDAPTAARTTSSAGRTSSAASAASPGGPCAEVDRAVLVCTLVLVGVLAAQHGRPVHSA